MTNIRWHGNWEVNRIRADAKPFILCKQLFIACSQQLSRQLLYIVDRKMLRCSSNTASGNNGTGAYAVKIHGSSFKSSSVTYVLNWMRFESGNSVYTVQFELSDERNFLLNHPPPPPSFPNWERQIFYGGFLAFWISHFYQENIFTVFISIREIHWQILRRFVFLNLHRKELWLESENRLENSAVSWHNLFAVRR